MRHAAIECRANDHGLAAVLALMVGGLAAYAIRDGGSGSDATTVLAGKAPGVTAEMVRDGDSGTSRGRAAPAPEDLSRTEAKWS